MRLRARACGLAAACALYALAVLAQLQAGATMRPPAGEELLYLPNERLLTHFTAGLSSVAADVLWLQCVLYTGRQAQGDGDFRWLNQMLNTVVRLDPYFVDAYRYGGMFLASLQADDHASLDLLHRGIVRNPHRWELPYEAALVYLLNRRDDPEGPRRAAIYLAMSTAAGGAPPYVSDLAAHLQGDFDIIEVEEHMWAQVLDRGDAPLRAVAERKLQELALRRACRVLTSASQAYTARTGQSPGSLEDLWQAGLIQTLPRDPLGGTFLLAPDRQVLSTTILDAETERRIKILRGALDRYRAQSGQWPATLEALVGPGLMTAIPPHPYPDRAWRYDPAAGVIAG